MALVWWRYFWQFPSKFSSPWINWPLSTEYINVQKNLFNFWNFPSKFPAYTVLFRRPCLLGGLTFLNGWSGPWMTFNNLAVTSSTKSVVKSPSFVKFSSFSGNNFLIACNNIMSPSAILGDKIDKLQKSRNSPKKSWKIIYLFILLFWKVAWFQFKMFRNEKPKVDKKTNQNMSLHRNIFERK